MEPDGRPPCYSFRAMNRLSLRAVLMMAALAAQGHVFCSWSQTVPEDPDTLLAAAEPLYDFNSPELKPWHLKATYQLYDDRGKPTEQGTYEYWWASPQAYRSTWTRQGATYSDWHTPDGRHVVLSKGLSLGYFEEELHDDFVAPLPPLLPDKYQISGTRPRAKYKSTMIRAGSFKLPCVVAGQGRSYWEPDLYQFGPLPSSTPSYYCFDPALHVLRVEYQFGVVATEVDSVVKMQGRILVHGIRVADGKRSLLTAELDTVSALSPSDWALVPDPAGRLVPDPKPGKPVIPGKWTGPAAMQVVRHPDQKSEVLLRITIAADGSVRDPQVILAPSDEWAQKERRKVSQWRFTPFMQDGMPVEVKILINDLIFLS